MPDGQEKGRIVVVTGDVTMDWHLTNLQVVKKERRDREEWQEWNPENKTHIHWERGGAARLADLVKAMMKMAKVKGGEVMVRKVRAPISPSRVRPKDAFCHSYALWSYFATGGKDPEGDDQGIWRVSTFLGLEHLAEPLANPEIWPGKPGDNIGLVILDDANLGFRNHDLSQFIGPLSKDAWIIIKMADPVAQGKLWDYLFEHHAHRLIAVIPVNDLRRREVRISRQLSWERTAQDLVWELTHNPKINALCRCAHVVISFDSAGAFLYSRHSAKDPKKPRKTLFFQPQQMEGLWGRDHKGGLIGYTSCLVAGIALRVVQNDQNPDIPKGIAAGLAAMRALYKSGYKGEKPRKLKALKFPFKPVLVELLKDSEIPEVEVKPPLSFKTNQSLWEEAIESDYWSILQEKYKDNLVQIARNIVKYGVEAALKDVPLGQFANLLTIDRQEIENFRNIRILIREYFCRSLDNKPLSIAVFGPPGSGKSFGIGQVARSIIKGGVEQKEFNLSQFKGPEDLLGAFHQVRDLGLTGKLPLVFWDEFDSLLQDKPWGWLRFFLSPMQDGTFQEGQITHPIGRAIFVFAGGTSSTLEEFANLAFSQDKEEFRKAKGPDFVSRIKAHIDIKGPNRPKVEVNKSLKSDPFFVIRRAIILRHLLILHWPKLIIEKNNKRILSIDPGVLRAFLEIEEYKHGVRSMENIITTSILYGQNHYERSSLPPEEQLDLHVNACDFLDLVHTIVLDEETKLEKLAEGVYDAYEKWFGSTSPINYESLDELQKEWNRSSARHIPIMLARLGLSMVKAHDDLTVVDLKPHIERLAEIEHNRWLKEKVDLGWRYGPVKDPEKKENPNILLWRKITIKNIHQVPIILVAAIGKDTIIKKELPQPTKEKNIGFIKDILEYLKKVGFMIVKLPD